MIRRAALGLAVALSIAWSLRAAVAEMPAPAAPDVPAPHIHFDATDVDLGDVVHGQDAAATFTYHNTGTAPLHILSAKPG
jgi:hypothetical protein